MELRALFLLPLCFPGLRGQTVETKRREGGTLHIQCPYHAPADAVNTKYWCRKVDGKCQVLVDTYYNYKAQTRDMKITIEDDYTSKTVSITMTDLKAEDSGTYFCAYHSNGFVPLRTVSLFVSKELLQWELDTVSVQCPRSPQGSSMTWCRREGPSQCMDLLETQQNLPAWRNWSKSPPAREWIEYKIPQRTLTVTMKKLQTWDTGVYWCALGPHRTPVMEVVLSVSRRTQQHTAKEAGNVSVQCQYKIPDYAAVSKAWCKKEMGKPCNVLATTSPEPPAGQGPAQEGGVRIQDDPKQGIVTVTMEQLQAQDSGVYWCALQERSGLSRIEEVRINVSRALPRRYFPDTESKNQEILLGDSPEPSFNVNTFIILSAVLLLLLLLALVTSVALGVRHYRLLRGAGDREAEDASDRAEGTAQPGSPGRRESSQDDSKGPAYINLEVQSSPSPEDPLYCNMEQSQAPRNPRNVEYAVIAFNQTPRNDRG